MTQTSAIRLSAHHKPHPNMGKLRHNGTVPIKDVCPSTRVVIERPLGNMSFALISECGGKYTTFLRINKLLNLFFNNFWTQWDGPMHRGSGTM